MSNDASIVEEFKRIDPDAFWRMQQGYAPRVDPSQNVGENRSYILHHREPIYDGGSVYDIDNLIITTPRYHKEVLTPEYHYNR